MKNRIIRSDFYKFWMMQDGINSSLLWFVVSPRTTQDRLTIVCSNFRLFLISLLKIFYYFYNLKNYKYFIFSCRNISLDINSSASIEFLVKVNWKPSLVFSVTIAALLTYFWQHLERKFDQWEIDPHLVMTNCPMWEGSPCWNNFYNEMQICEMTELIFNNFNNLCQQLCRERTVI